MIKKLCACLFILVFFSSCGEKPLTDQDTFVSSSLKSSCEVDTKIFEKFFKEPIPEAIDCLEKSLNQFASYVKREEDNSIGFSELERFATKFFPKDPQKLSGALKIFFQVNSLLLNDPANRLSTKNIGPVFKIIKLFNKQAVIINNLLKEENRNQVKDLWKIRKAYNEALIEFRDLTLGLVPQNSQHTNDINLHNLIRDIKDNVGAGSADIDMLESLLFAKKILLGGSSDFVNANELRRIISLAPEYGLIVFDVLYMDESQFTSKNERLSFFSQRLEDLRPLLYPWGPNEVLFNKTQILTAAKELDLKEDLLNKADIGIDIIKDHLLGGERRNFSSRDLNTIISYARVALEAMQVVNAYNDAPNSSAFKKATEEQVAKIKTIINAAPILPTEMNFEKLLADVNNSLILFDTREKDEVLNALLGVKKLLMGGKEDILTEREFRSLLDKATDYASMAYELLKIKKDSFAQDYDYYNFLLEKLDLVTQLTTQNYEADEVILGVEDLMILAERIVGEPETPDVPGSMDRKINYFAFTKYTKSLIKIMPRIYPTEDGSKITYKIVRSALADVRQVLEAIIFTDVGWKQHERLLGSTKAITQDLPVTKIEALSLIAPERLATYQKNFNQVARNYRFFPRTDLPFYGDEIKRDRASFVIMGAFKWAATWTLNAYRRESSLKEFESTDITLMIEDLKEALIHLDLYPNDPVKFPGNMLLISDFFEYQSDGSMTMNDNELTEYLVLLFTTGKMSTDIYHDLISNPDPAQRCSYYSEKVGNKIISGFKQECVLKHYGKALLDNTNHKSHLPAIQKFREKVGEDNFYLFTENLTKFVRDNPHSAPMEKREINLLVAGMLDVESTFLRFNVDNSEYIEGKELDEMFKIYENGIMLVAKLKESQRKYVKSIFFYLIEKNELPTPVKLLKFHYLKNKKKIKADRLDIASVLKNLAGPAPKTTIAEYQTLE